MDHNELGMEGMLPTLMAPDPGGLLARRASHVMNVLPLETPVQHSPQWSWSPGTPYPGPPAVMTINVDVDSANWWGRTGQGHTIWSDGHEISADLPPAIPFDMAQHFGTWHFFQGGYASMDRNRPPAFGDQVPTFNPIYPAY
jgi:hypothetical protein